MWRLWIVVGLFVAAGLLVPPRASEARPQYLKVFKKVYPDACADKVKCTLCHAEKTKKERNDYGAKLEKELGETNVKDESKIEEALKKIGEPEDGDCAPIFQGAALSRLRTRLQHSTISGGSRGLVR